MLRKLLAIGGLLLVLVWFLSTLGHGFSCPAWVPAAGCSCVAGAVFMLVFGWDR